MATSVYYQGKPCTGRQGQAGVQGLLDPLVDLEYQGTPLVLQISVLAQAKTHTGFLRYRQHPESHSLRQVATSVFYQGDPGVGGEGKPGVQGLLHPLVDLECQGTPPWYSRSTRG